MKVLSIHGSPGSGKSSSSLVITGYLKNRGCNVELVREFVKDLCYSKRDHELSNQIYILAKQYKRLKDIQLYEKIPLVITDCPLVMTLAYAKNQPYYKEYEALTYKLAAEFENINVFVKRVKPYNPVGRWQTEEESDKLAEEIRGLMEYDYYIEGDEKGQIEFAKFVARTYYGKE